MNKVINNDPTAFKTITEAVYYSIRQQKGRDNRKEKQVNASTFFKKLRRE